MIAAIPLISIACSMRHGVIVWGLDPVVFKDACQASVVNRAWLPLDPFVGVATRRRNEVALGLAVVQLLSRAALT